MIQSRTQDDDLLFAQEPGKAISTHCESSDASGRAVPQGQNVKRNRGGGLNRIKPKTGKSAEKRRRRLERIRSNMLAEKAEKAADANTRSDSVAETKSIAAAAQPVVNPGPRFSEADLTPKRSRKRSKPKETADDPTVASSELSAFAAFEVSTKTPRKKTRVNKSNIRNSDVAGSYQVIDPPPPEPETYREWFKRVVANHRWTTWFTTFYIHWLLLLMLAAIIVHGPENTASLLISATFAETVEEEIPTFEIVSPEPEPQPETESESVTEPEAEAVEMEEEEVELSPDMVSKLATEPPPESTSKKSASTESSKAAEQATSASAIDAFNPAPPSAVSEGSFSVWTEPSTPKAGEPYRIIIQVRLPASIPRYELTDLQGVVVGSDGYRKPIPGSMRGALPIDNGYARFAVPIVSADAQVRDTVFIRSRMLKETQKLVLQF